ncbi:MAG: flagellar biosynthetic protein FliR [Pseudomonadota bacterium]
MLEQLLGVSAGTFVLVLARVGAVVAIAPAIGESAIPGNIRALLALVLSVVIYPTAAQQFALGDISLFALIALVVKEVAIGLFIGIIGRIALSALNIAGTVIAFQSGLAAAQSFDPSQGTQGALIARFLTLLGVTMIFATGLHHLLIQAIAKSFILFPPDKPLMMADAAQLVILQVASAFALGMQIAAPFLAYGMLFNIGLGIIARLMPQLPIFFVAMPANIAVGFILFTFTVSAMMLWFVQRFEEAIMMFLKAG